MSLPATVPPGAMVPAGRHRRRGHRRDPAPARAIARVMLIAFARQPVPNGTEGEKGSSHPQVRDALTWRADPHDSRPRWSHDTACDWSRDSRPRERQQELSRDGLTQANETALR